MSRIRSTFQTFGFAILTALLATNVHAQARDFTEAERAAVGEIEDLRNGWVEAYRAQDVEAISRFYHPDATFAGTLQPFWLEGGDAIQDLWARYFAAWDRVNIIFRQPTVQFYDTAVQEEGQEPMVAVETGYLEMFMVEDDETDDQGRTIREGRVVITNIRYSITRVFTRENGWQIASMNVARLPGTE
ncbi:YybH family protein [Aestuariibius sp. 2305UL40-4]|uniref:YybH family protein n=1 Tax=Aestuariibius violaceus TaxID=3234132 RepID=UPI00345EE35B